MCVKSPCISNTPLHVRLIRTDHFAGTNTLFFNTLEALFSYMVPQVPSEIMDPFLCQSISIRKSTKILYFAYSYYSLSYTFFLASIHCLSKSFFYKEAIFDHL